MPNSDIRYRPRAATAQCPPRSLCMPKKPNHKDDYMSPGNVCDCTSFKLMSTPGAPLHLVDCASGDIAQAQPFNDIACQSTSFSMGTPIALTSMFRTRGEIT